jgi:hypothetical protein
MASYSLRRGRCSFLSPIPVVRKTRSSMLQQVAWARNPCALALRGWVSPSGMKALSDSSYRPFI